MSTQSVNGELSLSYRRGAVSLEFNGGPLPLHVVQALVAACGEVTLQIIEPDGVSPGSVSTLQIIEPDGVSSGGVTLQIGQPDGVSPAVGV
jgi:hypothetical protein